MTNRHHVEQIRHANGWTHQQLADELTHLTGDRVSVHAVRAWLADPARLYSRPCPGWVLVVLDSDTDEGPNQ